jgi:leucyl-tRNA synthetase
MSNVDLQNRSALIDELAHLKDAKEFLESKFGLIVEIFSVDEQKLVDPSGKAKQAIPWRPGIFIE